MNYVIEILKRVLDSEKECLNKLKSRRLQECIKINISDIENAIQILNKNKK